MLHFIKNIEILEDIKIVLIMTRYKGKWIFCKRALTYECPGVHVEKHESHYEASCRELEEETGAKKYHITFLSYFYLHGTEEFKDSKAYGAFYMADVQELGNLAYEIKKIDFFDELPKQLSYPETQKALMSLLDIHCLQISILG